jgi:hypothetical protein
MQRSCNGGLPSLLGRVRARYLLQNILNTAATAHLAAATASKVAVVLIQG